VLTQDEKDRIAERVRFEADLRREFASDQAPPRTGFIKFVESKLGLLLLGFLLTGVLVPLLQYVQETIKWERQNRYENAKYRLGLMRQCMTEFVYLSAFTSEAYLKAEPFLSPRAAPAVDTTPYRAQRVELENRRFQQNAKVVSLFIYFKSRDELSSLFNSYLAVVGDFMSALDRQVAAATTSAAGGRGTDDGVSIDDLTLRLNEAYNRVLNRIKQEVEGVEDESESFM
jgi:hypothetical protein